jgi:hypothetical protein
MKRFIPGLPFVDSVILLETGSRDKVLSPTIQLGDVKVSKNFGSFANIGTLPAVTPAGSGQVKLTLNSGETSNVRTIQVQFKDVFGAEWEEQTLIYYAADASENMVRYKIGEVDERLGVTSNAITKSGYPKYSVLYTDLDCANGTDFDERLLLGAIIKAAEEGHPMMILGGYFFDDTTDTTKHVFGIAKDSRFGIVEDGSVFVNTNWTGAGAEATHGDGWTFIIAPTFGIVLPGSGTALEIFINPDWVHESLIADTEKIALESSLQNRADAIDLSLDTLSGLIGTPADTDIATDIANVQSSVDSIDVDLGTYGATIDAIHDGVDSIELDLNTISVNIEAVPTTDVLKDTLFERNVVSRHANGKPESYLAGTGANQETVQTTQDGNGNTETETIA